MSPHSYRTLSRGSRPVLMGLILLLMGLALATVSLAGQPDLFLDALLQRPHEKGTVVVPDRFLREWDPVTVFFPSQRGRTGPEDAPEQFVTVSPAHPGAWTWLDSHTLQFRPAEPWPALSRFTVTVDDEPLTLSTLMAPPAERTPGPGHRDLETVETLELGFDRPLPASDLAKMVSLEIRPLPGLGDGPSTRLDDDDFEVKALARDSADARSRYVVQLNQPIPAGIAVTARLRLALDEDPDASLTEWHFSTAEPFRPRQLGCASGQGYPVSTAGAHFSQEQILTCRGQRAVALELSDTPRNADEVVARQLLRFEPAVEDLSIRVQSRRLVVQGSFQDETPYKVRLIPGSGLSDRRGRPLELEGESEVHVLFPRAEPFLTWDLGEGVVERFGDKRLPVRGRAHPRADLRIYKVDPENLELWPFSDTPVTVDESLRPAGPGEGPRPHDPVRITTPAQLAERIHVLGSPTWSSLVDLPLDTRGGAARFGLDITDALAEADGADAPGHYLVGLRRLDQGASRSWVRVQVTDLSLTTVEEPDRVRFQVTSLRTGDPVSGAEVRIDGVRTPVHRRDGDPELQPLLSSTTGADGTLAIQAPGSDARYRYDVRRVVVTHGEDTLVLDPARPPRRFADGHWHTQRGWLDWLWHDLDHRGESDAELAHLYTERPIYRPDESVHLRAHVRHRVDGRFRAVTGAGRFVVSGPGGASWQLPVELSGAGNAYALWDEDEVPTGTYQAWLELDDPSRRLGEVSWQVEAYELPRFEVDLHASQTIPLDEPAEVTLTASYFAGGRVSEQPVRWRITQYPYTWTPPSGSRPEGFVWSSDGRWSRQDRFRSTPTLVREEQTDDNGQSTMLLDPTLEPTAQARTYAVEATVTGADAQTVTQTLLVRAVPAFTVGLNVPRFLEDVDRIRPEILVVGPDGEPLPGQKLTVRLKHRQWHSHLQASDFSDGEAKYITDMVDVTVAEKRVRSGKDPIAVGFPVSEPGVYLVEVEGQDRLGRSQVVSVDLYAGGTGAVSWDKPKAGVFSLSANQQAFEPGETAKIVVRSPYQRAEGLVVVETPIGNRYQPVSVRNGQATVSIPVEEGWVPRIPVHVVLRRGRTGDAPASMKAPDTGKPVTVAATEWLTIEPVEHQVEVTLDHPEEAQPGDIVPMDIHLRTPDGEPVSGEVTLWLVDQAVLSLAAEQRLDPLPDLIPGRSSHVSIVDTRNAVLGRIPWASMPGGDGGEDGAADGESPLEKATVRKDFDPMPYYRHDLQIDGDGRVEIQLPDDLTVFQVRAKVTSGADRFGVAKSRIQVRLPLIVQPALPRFVRPTDAFGATAIGRVVEGPGGPGEAEIAVDGLELLSDPRFGLTWEAGVATPLTWNVEVPRGRLDSDGRPERESVSVSVGVTRSADNVSDAFKVLLPVRPDRTPRYQRRIAVLEPGVPFVLEAVPDAVREGSVRRSVVVSDDPALIRMAAALDLLRVRPAGNTEQRVAEARAWLALRRFKVDLGLFQELERSDEAIEAAVAAMGQSVDDHGLVAYWPGTSGSVPLTAWSLMLLTEMQDAGLPVDRGLRKTLVRTLSKALRSDYSFFVDGGSMFERSIALEALVASGEAQPAYVSELARSGTHMSAEGVGRVLIAAHRAGASRALQRQLIDELGGRITVQLHEGEEVYAGLDGQLVQHPRIHASEARAIATVIRALHRADPEHPRLPLLVEALVNRGGVHGWGGVNADAAALFALSERLESGTGASGAVTLVEDGSQDVLGFGGGEPPAVQRTSASAGKLVANLSGERPAVIWVTTRWVPAGSGAEAAALTEGFVVQRSFERVGTSVTTALESPGLSLEATRDDVIEEHLTVVNPDTRHFVSITAPLAAGLELLDPTLDTAPPEATPSRSDSHSASAVFRYDDQITWVFETLPAGTVHLYWRGRASNAGTFVQPPGTAFRQYAPEINGASPGAHVTVSPSTGP